MARPLRVDIADGWYHITARGTDRRTIFTERREREHFLELLEALVNRYGVRLHAYVLMDNHYHLLLQTPRANLSAALQWLQVSYSMWFNRRHERVGPLFQGRFKSVPVDGEGSWALMASVYLHLNPLRVRGLGLSKAARRAEGLGIRAAEPTQIRERLRVLCDYRWSSYRVYAGYTSAPGWLTTAELLRRGEGRAAYRRYVMQWVTQGREPAEFAGARERWLWGAQAFKDRLRHGVRAVNREHPERRELRVVVPLARIVATVAAQKGERWEVFRDRYGDWGRDLVMYAARQHSGLTLRQIGEQCGGVAYKQVSKAVERFGRRLDTDRSLARLTRRVLATMTIGET